MTEQKIGIANKETFGIEGIHTFTLCDMRDKRAWNLQCLIEGVIAKRQQLLKTTKATAQQLHTLWQEYRWYVDQLNRRFAVEQQTIKNITTTAGRSVVAQRLSGTTTYTGIVNYCALGTSATSPTVGDTKLGTETYRKALSSCTFSSNIAYLEEFFTSTEVTGTFQEYGFFIDGTGTVDSGQLWNRFTAAQAKTNVQSLNVQSIITLSNV